MPGAPRRGGSSFRESCGNRDPRPCLRGVPAGYAGRPVPLSRRENLPYSGAMNALLPIMLFAATGAFALGVTLPLIRVERFFLFADEPSLIALVSGLWKGGDPFLAAVVGFFSIVFPAVKLCLLHVAAHGGPEAARAVPGWVRGLSNWSMLDVVLVALVIFAAKTTGLASAFTRPGLWFFTLSVVLTAAVSALLKRRAGIP